MRHPPNAVPKAIAVRAAIFTHSGTPASGATWCVAIKSNRITPMVFCASLVPCPRLYAAADSS